MTVISEIRVQYTQAQGAKHATVPTNLAAVHLFACPLKDRCEAPGLRRFHTRARLSLQAPAQDTFITAGIKQAAVVVNLAPDLT